jgi:hypothetical protein
VYKTQNIVQYTFREQGANRKRTLVYLIESRVQKREKDTGQRAGYRAESRVKRKEHVTAQRAIQDKEHNCKNPCKPALTTMNTDRFLW